MVIRVAANLDDLERSLDDANGAIEGLAGDLAAASAAFDGGDIAAQASAAEAALDDIGDAAALTAAEQEGLNAAVANGVTQYGALESEGPPALDAVAASTKNVNEQTSGLSTTMIAIGTAIGNLGAELLSAGLQLVIDLAKQLGVELANIIVEGSDVADLSSSFDTLTGSAGLLGDTLLTRLRAGTQNTITDMELMQTVNRDLNAGMALTESSFGVLADGAFALANATGKDVSEAFDLMNDAMLTGRTRALEMEGIHVNLTEAELRYADANNIVGRELEKNEKLEAARAGILDAVAASTRRLGEQTAGLDEMIQQGKVSWSNYRAELGKAVNESGVLSTGVKALQEAMVRAFGGSTEAMIAGMTNWINTAAIAVVDAGIKVVDFGTFAARAFGVVKTPIDAITTAIMFFVEKMTSATAWLVELAAKAPGVGDQFRGVAEQTRAIATEMTAARLRAQEQLAASVDLAQGQGVVIEALGRTRQVLVDTKAAMEGAQRAHEAASTAARDHATAADTTTAALQRTGQTVDGLIPNLRSFGDGLAAYKRPIADTSTEVEQLTAHLRTGLIPATTLFNQSLAQLKKPVDDNSASLTVLNQTAEASTDALTTAGGAAVDMSDKVRFAAETVQKMSVSWSEAMDLVRQGQGTMTGQIASRGPSLRGKPSSEWAKIAAEAGGTVRFDSYNNPYVDFTGGFGGGTATPNLLYSSQANLEQMYGGPFGAAAAFMAPFVGGGGGTTTTTNINVNTVMGDKHEIARVVKDALADDWRSTGTRA
jgi:hypothetical protein